MTVGQKKLRKWQGEFFEERVLLRQPEWGKDDLLVATPAAGKTTAALATASHLMEVGIARRVVIVVPNRHLKRQWRAAAKKFGLELAADWKNAQGAAPKDFHGVVMTYAQVARFPDLHQFHCAETPTFVILDEIHHAGEKKAWGDGVRVAFAPAIRRLALSGTPWRQDGTEIPYVEYDDDGYTKSTFSYSYMKAVLDRHCRMVFFPRTGGETEWQSKGQERKATFDDELPKQLARERLRTALDSDTAFMREFLTDAHRRLCEMREEDPLAAGLVLAMNVDHAHRLAALMRKTLGVDPVIVVSRKPEAEDGYDVECSQKIDAFTQGREPWVIAVRMIAEGVDIPRLRVLAYATNVLTVGAFRQAVGRIIRRTDLYTDKQWNDLTQDKRDAADRRQRAICLIPDDPYLREFAQGYINERVAALKVRLDPGDREPDDTERDKPERDFIPLSATAEFAGVTFEGDEVTAYAYLTAEEAIIRAGGLPDGAFVPMEDATIVAKILSKYQQGTTTGFQPAEAEGLTLEERKAEMRGEQNRLVQRYCKQHNIDFRTVNGWLNRSVGVYRIQECTEEQLDKRGQLARDFINGLVGPE